jgi:hypothetical protein
MLPEDKPVINGYVRVLVHATYYTTNQDVTFPKNESDEEDKPRRRKKPQPKRAEPNDCSKCYKPLKRPFHIKKRNKWQCADTTARKE